MRIKQALLISVAALNFSPAAFAQGNPAPPAGAQTDAAPQADTGVAEIVVTATRDPSKESKTPISMQVYSGASLLSKGVANIQALVTADSSLNINAGGGQPFIAMRGVSTSDTSEVGDPAVPVSIDNLFTNRAYALNTGFFDINRVEVLRGPQGTLFGRNALGGIINIYTNDPGKQLGGFVDLEGGNYRTINASAAVNLPLTDTLQARASFNFRNHDGYRNLPGLGRGDDANVKAGRIKLAWQPATGVNVGFQYQHNEVDQTGITEQLLPFVGIPTTTQTTNGTTVVVPNGTVGAGVATGNLLDRSVRYSGNGRSFALQYLPLEQLREDTFHWNASAELGEGLTLSYLGGYDDLKRHRITPQSSVAANPFGFPNAGFVQDEGARTLNQEVRLSSAQQGPLTWQIGSFYFNEKGNVNTNLFFNYLLPNQARFITFNYPSVKAESIAGYGQASYAVTPTVKLTGGVRYTYDTKSKVGGTDTLDLKAFAPFLPTFVTPSSGHSSSGVWTYHIGIDWQAAPSTLVYAHTDKGYKAGGYNSGDAVPYLPEKLYAYEVGAKSRLLGGHLTVSAAAFYQVYLNQQVFESVDPLTNNGATSNVINAGKSRIYGLEVGGVAASDGFGQFDVNATYDHARYVNYRPLDQALDGTTLFPGGIDLKGKTLANSPDFSATAGYEHKFAGFGGTITPRIDGKYQSVKYFTAFNTPDGRQDGNLVANASIRWVDATGHLTVEVYVRNLTDKTVLTDFAEQKDSKIYQYGFIPPRTFGARVHLSY